MSKLCLLCLVLLLTFPSSGYAQSGAVSIAPCLPQSAALIRIEGVDKLGGVWMQVIGDRTGFYALQGEPIKWLGYAPKGQEYKEWQGGEYGFGGVDMRLYGEQFYIYLYSDGKTFKDREVVGRIEVHSYGKQYIMFMTTLNTFGLSDGLRNAYHVIANPMGGACMFFIPQDEFNKVLGWD